MATIGEETFEKYLNARGIEYEFEKRRQDKKRPPDYTILHDREYLLEVKDFEPTDVPECGSYDGYARLRAKIDSASKKFREYEDYPCALVLYNNNALLVDIITPEFVLGAMYGNACIVIPFNTKTGEAIGEEYPAFHGGGKMIRPGWKKPANTRISALISLRYVPVGAMRQRKYLSDLELEETDRVKRASVPHGHLTHADRRLAERRLRVARATAAYEQMKSAEMDFDQTETQLGVVVWENAYAAIPFPRDLFCGDYDEIYGIEGEYQGRVFAGKGILAYEEIEASCESRNLFDIVKGKARRASS